MVYIETLLENDSPHKRTCRRDPRPEEGDVSAAIVPVEVSAPVVASMVYIEPSLEFHSPK